MKTKALLGLVLLGIQSSANAFVHSCGHGLITLATEPPLNPTVYISLEFTSDEQFEWQEWRAWPWYEATGYTQTTNHSGVHGDRS